MLGIKLLDSCKYVVLDACSWALMLKDCIRREGCHEPSSIGYMFLAPPTAMGGAHEFQHFSPATN